MKMKLVLMLIASFLLIKADAQTKHSSTSRFTSYKGLIMAGYQGWHNTPEDGAGRGWGHYLDNRTRKPFADGNLKIDLWPELNEYKKLYRTPFKHADSSIALLPSDNDESTTDVRFKWMKDYNVDGVFMQRFIGNTKKTGDGSVRNHFIKVIADAFKASKKYDRAIAIMYDLSGMRDTADIPVFINDWKMLVDSLKVTSGGNKQTYLYHNGKPLVVIWGVGFNDGRNYTLKTVERLIEFLKNDPQYGGCSVMLGVPTYWREFGRDCVKDTMLHDLLRKVDIVHPWTVGRYRDEATYATYAEVLKGDIKWCKENKVDYVPNVFPGFSWHNLNPNSPLNQIPRNRGQFFWAQLKGAIKSGAEMIYVAMFDEVDEGTAIMKVSKDPPAGLSSFVKFEDDIPSDYYLYLTGYAGQILKRKIPFKETIPLPKNSTSSR